MKCECCGSADNVKLYKPKTGNHSPDTHPHEWQGEYLCTWCRIETEYLEAEDAMKFEKEQDD
jgi:hypothetical protein